MAQMAEHTVVKSTISGVRLPGADPHDTLTRWGSLSAFLSTSTSVSSTVDKNNKESQLKGMLQD